jgi:hypothetical protein
MTDVLEIMAKAAWEHPDGPTLWRDLPENMRTSEIAAMRAALLALAEADISREMIDAGLEDDDTARRFEDAFRSICRSLAEGE